MSTLLFFRGLAVALGTCAAAMGALSVGTTTPCPFPALVAPRKFIARSTAFVYRSTDGEFALKYYSSRDRALAQMEQWSARFLRSRGEQVPEVLETRSAELPDKVAEAFRQAGLPTEGATLVVKPFIPGTPFFQVPAGDKRTPQADLEALNRRIRILNDLYTSGEFERWLATQGVPAGTFSRTLLRTGDVSHKDFVLTAEGWVLVDP